MAKDVDLSSKEWIELVFEGKNKEFGAYELRKASAKRHNMSMLVILIVLLIVALLGLLANTVMNKAEDRPEDQIEQTMIDYSADEQQEEDQQEEPEQQRFEEQQPEALPEEILNTVKSTELQITKDEEVVEEIKSQPLKTTASLTLWNRNLSSPVAMPPFSNMSLTTSAIPLWHRKTMFRAV